MKNRALILLVLLALSTLWGCGGRSPETSRKDPDVFLLVVDSFRNDHLSGNGYHRNTTPVIDSLASSGCIWSEVQAQSSWTMPSMASILTGLSQRVHRAGFDDGLLYGVDPLLPTLPMLLERRARYQTAGFFSSIYLSEVFGFHHEFSHFDCEQTRTERRMRNASETVDTFLCWYDSCRDVNRPMLAVLHFNDPHLPYSPPPPWDTLFTSGGYRGSFGSSWGNYDDLMATHRSGMEPDSLDLENLTALYDGELAYVDHEIGRLISEMRHREGLDNAIFIVTGTHGEELGDHGGIGNGHTLYQEILSVPLVISGAGAEPRGRRTMIAAHTDILPTVMTMCGLDQPLWAKGDILLGDSAAISSRAITSSNLFGDVPQMGSVRLSGMILIGDVIEYHFLQFNLSTDPEQKDSVQPTSDLVDKLLVYWSSPVNGHPVPVYSRDAMLDNYFTVGLHAGCWSINCMCRGAAIFYNNMERA